MARIDIKWLEGGWLRTMKEKPDHMSYQAFIASNIRRNGRIKGGSMLGKSKISTARHESRSTRQLYRAGLEDGRKENVKSLADVLYAVSQLGLGRASVIQESNSHLLIKVFDCVCCQTESDHGWCEYLGGFLAGAMQACGRYREVKIQEISCGYPGRTCLFQASW